LTSLPNRLAFFEGLESAFSRLNRLGEQFAILYLDLNDFKIVNDRYGHTFGDKLLVEVSRRLKGCLREMDLVARLGGDEFAIVVANAQGLGIPTAVAAQVVSNLDRSFVIDGLEVYTGGCIGIAFAPDDGDNPEVLLKNADEALYDAKHRPGGVVQLFDDGPREAARKRRALERDLRHAFHRGEFFLVFQPILNLQSNRIAGCEALLRWRHPKCGTRLPNEFMKALEATPLISKIGQWVLLEACRAAVTWPGPIRVAVNLSAVQLRNSTLLAAVVAALNASNLPAERLELEITETVVVDESEQVFSNLRALRMRELELRLTILEQGTPHSPACGGYRPIALKSTVRSCVSYQIIQNLHPSLSR
jgi:diguanylate cyclase (GGDEF)-like protein